MVVGDYKLQKFRAKVRSKCELNGDLIFAFIATPLSLLIILDRFFALGLLESCVHKLKDHHTNGATAI